MRPRLIALLPLALALPGCTGITPPVTTPTVAPAPERSEPDLFGSDDILAPEVLAEGTFQPSGTPAIAYDSGLVPPGATARLTSFAVADGLAIRLSVAGLVPRHVYGAHLDTAPCPPAPAPVPSAPSVPVTASVNAAPPASAAPVEPSGEVWLTLAADRDGRGTVTTVRQEAFAAGSPRSLVLHAGPARTAAGAPGPAGAAVACLTVDGG